MIVIKLEMWPGGRADRAYTLGRAYIYNKSRHDDPKRGDYNVCVMKKASHYEDAFADVPNQATSIARRGEVLDYPRLTYNIWILIARALKSAGFAK